MIRRLAVLLSPIVLAGLSVPASAQAMSAYDMTEAAAALSPGRFIWPAGSTATGPMSVLISLPDQRAYVFRGETMIAATTISTGKDGKETPVGSYPILQKKAVHHSNLYDDAPMPFMQRLTWDGVALHAGRNPGFPASHGCVRLPAAFAKKLFEATQLGDTVEVTDVAYIGDPIDDAMAGIAEEQATRSANAAAKRTLDRRIARR